MVSGTAPWVQPGEEKAPCRCGRASARGDWGALRLALFGDDDAAGHAFMAVAAEIVAMQIVDAGLLRREAQDRRRARGYVRMEAETRRVEAVDAVERAELELDRPALPHGDGVGQVVELHREHAAMLHAGILLMRRERRRRHARQQHRGAGRNPASHRLHGGHTLSAGWSFRLLSACVR